MNTPNQDGAVHGAPRRNRLGRAFVPERKPEHSLWQWVLVIAARIAAVPVLTFVLLTGIGYCQAVTGTGSLGEFSLMGFNRTDRYVADFYVDGGWGGNLFPVGNGGGGSATCCTSIPRGSKTLHVKWILGWSNEADFDRRAPQETYEADVPIPPQPDLGGDNYIQIYFFPGNRIGVHLGQSTLDFNVQPQVSGVRVADTPYKD